MHVHLCVVYTNLYQAIEYEQGKNDNEKRGCGHNNDNQRGYHGHEGEDEGT